METRNTLNFTEQYGNNCPRFSVIFRVFRVSNKIFYNFVL